MLILAIRFAAELLGVVLAAILGGLAPLAQPWPSLLAIAAPIAMVVFWGAVAAPKARNPLPPVIRELIGTAVLLLIATLLGVAGQPWLAAGYAALVVVDHTLILVLDPRPAVDQRLVVARH